MINLYKEGDCFRNINPYPGEPEYMVAEVRVKGHEDCYLAIALKGDVSTGAQCIMPHEEVHSCAYEKQS